MGPFCRACVGEEIRRNQKHLHAKQYLRRESQPIRLDLITGRRRAHRKLQEAIELLLLRKIRESTLCHSQIGNDLAGPHSFQQL